MHSFHIHRPHKTDYHSFVCRLATATGRSRQKLVDAVEGIAAEEVAAKDSDTDSNTEEG